MRVKNIVEGVLMVDLEPSGTTGWLATYVILRGDSVAIVDPGPKASLESYKKLIDALSLDRFKEVYIVLTHVHIDHSGVVGDLLEYLPSAKVLVHPRGVKHLTDPSKLWSSSLEVLGDVARLLGEPKPVPQSRILVAEDRAGLNLGDLVLVPIYTPGHATHHVSYMLDPIGILFAGDSIANYFNERIYPVTVHPFNGDEYLSSLDLMLKLRPKKIAVTHYGVITENPDVFIQRAKDKLISWTYSISNMINEGVLSVEEIYHSILSNDVELAYAKQLENSMPAFRGSTYRVIVGLYNYLLYKLKRANLATNPQR
ncbi:MAG: MBL fold metallo-hydrolase [Sulfolobales archaeon]